MKNIFKDSFQEFIFTRTYSRWADDENRRQTWSETVKRYCEYMKGRYSDSLSSKEYNDMYNAIYNLEVMPSMRALWSAGAAMDNDNVSAYNCFGIETQFITDKGVVSFSDLSNGDTITVLTHKGNWKRAHVRRHTLQKLNKITYGMGGMGLDHIVYATENHRWILSSGEETTKLQENDYLYKNPEIKEFNYEEALPEEKLYWCYGYVYGDGTKVKGKNGQYLYSKVRLCGKDKQYQDRFEEMGFKTSLVDSISGDFHAYTGGYLKTVPNLDKEPLNKIKAFLHGFLMADGAKKLLKDGKISFSSIQQSNEESFNFLMKALPMCGYYIYRVDDFSGQITNYKVRGFTKRIALVNKEATESNSMWKIRKIEETDRYENVWCLEVEDDHSFVFPNGVATGNCSFTTIEKVKDFCEIMYILMNGAGVGYSVEKGFIDNLPIINDTDSKEKTEKIIFEDSKLGWAIGFEKVLNCLWNGISFECDYSKIRERGARLKTFGGRASGPEPLKNLVEFTTKVIDNNRGMKLQSIDVHDIVCKIAEIVVVGGIRRSACISLSDLTDNQMATCKDGEFWNKNPQRQYSNNSVAYTRKPDLLSFLDEWKYLYKSNAGERGIFNRVASKNKANENGRRDGSRITGTNPCGEVLLRSKSFCNLTEVVVRPTDTFEDLKRKIKLASLIGTLQAGFTNFKYLDKKWKENCEEEALLGLSLTGVRDHKILGSVNDKAKKWLSDLKHSAISMNKKIATKIGVNQATAITCVKPSGTVSLLVNSSPGAHVRNTKTGYYIRRVRISATDPLFKMLKEQGVPYKCEVGQSPETASTFVLEFPCKVPTGAVTRELESAMEQLEFWKMYRDFWCEHNPSITIFIKQDEWLDTLAWVYKHFDDIGGLTFMPSDDSIYQLAPYEDISKEDYDKFMGLFPNIDFSVLSKYEMEDNTEGSKEYACTANGCMLV